MPLQAKLFRHVEQAFGHSLNLMARISILGSSSFLAMKSYRVSLKKRSFSRLAFKALHQAPRRSIRMKISTKHCKILSTCDLGTKILWQSSVWLLLAWSCGNAAWEAGSTIGPQVHCQQWGSHRKLMFNIHLSCSKRKFVQMQFTRGNRKGINLCDPLFMYIVEFWSRLNSTYQQWNLFCLNGP